MTQPCIDRDESYAGSIRVARSGVGAQRPDAACPTLQRGSACYIPMDALLCIHNAGHVAVLTCVCNVPSVGVYTQRQGAHT